MVKGLMVLVTDTDSFNYIKRMTSPKLAEKPKNSGYLQNIPSQLLWVYLFVGRPYTPSHRKIPPAGTSTL